MIRITERPCSRRSRSRSRRIPAWTVTSSAVVGSSAISSFGRVASALAIATRWRIPPENWCGNASSARSGSGSRTSPRSSCGAARGQRCFESPSWYADVLGELAADRHHRMERGERVLEDHRELAAADLSQAAAREREQVPAADRPPARSFPHRAGGAAGARAPTSSCRCRSRRRRRRSAAPRPRSRPRPRS